MTLAAAFAEERLPGVSPGVYSDADFRAIAELIYAESGNVLPDGKAMLVYSRIAPLVRRAGVQTFADYIALIRQDAAERKCAVDALTTNHTFFFREAHHFAHFAQVTRPALLDRLEQGEAVRLWSAGCSSGEETWSLVLTLLGEDRREGQAILKRDVRLLASDIADQVLRRAEAASYSEAEVKDVPPALRKAWLTMQDSEVRVREEARAIVRFRQLNLMGEWPMARSFEAIFCRNVMIYFDQPTKEKLVLRFAQRLRPGAFLYIGHSERVSGPATDLLDQVGPTIYRRRAA
ncbi:CheR family methyltransferase [Alteraurantiacibacter palmitatis]|uniref:Chemotaxis protein methyltransferase n=1 Tax=Alteraurantiacibacter palmitatis TaxID=2054628 RepID=A0ABV7E5Q7_9SPHN